MGYFPDKIMPPDGKKDIKNPTGAILSADFNRQGDEIIAIEKFLGNTLVLPDDVNTVLAGGSNPANVLGVIQNLVDEMNIFSSGGILTSSGYVHSTRPMIFPEGAHATFLTSSIGPNDTTINVNSTIGFSDTGILSILNDTQSADSTVEWIRYAKKTETAFVNCQRGYLGTTVGLHNGVLKDQFVTNPAAAGSQIQAIITANGKNVAVRCLPLNVNANQQLCDRVYPGWKAKTSFAFPAFELTGSMLDITRTIRIRPESFNLSPDFLNTTYLDVVAAAQAAGIFATRPIDGKLILKSNDPIYQPLHQLNWTEASTFVKALLTKNRIFSLKGASDWTTGLLVGGGLGPIPVFQGRMSVQWGLAAATINPIEPAVVETLLTSSILEALSIFQSADGRLMLIGQNENSLLAYGTSADPNALDQAILQYRTFFIPSSINSLQRKDF